jgi:hypothetical protein
MRNVAYQYDPVGNRQQVTDSGTGVSPVWYTANNLNQYTYRRFFSLTAAPGGTLLCSVGQSKCRCEKDKVVAIWHSHPAGSLTQLGASDEYSWDLKMIDPQVGGWNVPSYMSEAGNGTTTVLTPDGKERIIDLGPKQNFGPSRQLPYSH